MTNGTEPAFRLRARKHFDNAKACPLTEYWLEKRTTQGLFRKNDAWKQVDGIVGNYQWAKQISEHYKIDMPIVEEV